MAEDDSFPIQLKDVPEALQEDIKRATGEYVVPIVVDEIPLGSGTLAKIDGRPGILTAEHVVNHPTKTELRLTQPGRKLYTTVAEFAHELSVDSMALHVVTTGARRSDEYGPDLAFIALPPSPLLSQLKARKSFIDLTLKPDARIEAAVQNTGFVAFCGYPASKNYEAKAELGFASTLGLPGYAFLTGQEKDEVREGWDYLELGLGHDDTADIGPSFGGVSGAGVWRVPIFRHRKDPPGKEFFREMTLCGVAFYEEDGGRGGRFFIRAHGPRSIYERLVARVRDEFGPTTAAR